MSRFSAVAFDKAEITAKLANASGHEEIVSILGNLTKNALDEIACDEGINFPLAVSKMKRAEMVLVIANEIARRNEEIDNGHDVRVSKDYGLSPVMEARYLKNGNSEFIAQAKADIKARKEAFCKSITVRVINWAAVDNKKAPAKNPVSNTENEPEALTAKTSEADYSTVLEADDEPSTNGETGVGEITERNYALVKACTTPEELTALLRTADSLTLNRLFWRNAWLPVAYGHIQNDGTTADPLVDVRHIRDFVNKEFEHREMETSALVPCEQQVEEHSTEDLSLKLDNLYGARCLHDIGAERYNFMKVILCETPEQLRALLSTGDKLTLWNIGHKIGVINKDNSTRAFYDALTKERLVELCVLRQFPESEPVSEPVEEVIEAEIVEEPRIELDLRGITRQVFKETRSIANNLWYRKEARKRFENYAPTRKQSYNPAQITIQF